MRWSTGDLSGGVEALTASLAINRRLGQTPQVVSALQSLVFYDLMLDRGLQAELHQAEAAELAQGPTYRFNHLYGMALRGLLALFRGALHLEKPAAPVPTSPRWFEAAAEFMKDGYPRYEADLRVWDAIQSIVAGDVEDAGHRLGAAVDLSPHGDLVDIAMAHLTLLKARLGDPGAVPENDSTRAWLTAVLTASDPLQGFVPRLAAKVALTIEPVAGVDRATLIHPQGMWFRTADGETVHLGRRRAMRRILGHLASAPPDAAYEWDELFEHGWPGERASPESARQRVYVALSSLRKLGLGDAITKDEDGYALAPDVVRAVDHLAT